MSKYDIMNIREFNVAILNSNGEIDVDKLMKFIMEDSPYTFATKEPLVSISQVGEGKEYPHPSQFSRLKLYRRNKLIYDNRLVEALPGINTKLELLDKFTALKGVQTYINNPTIENWARVITNSKVRLLYSQGVNITAAISSKRKKRGLIKQIAELLNRSEDTNKYNNYLEIAQKLRDDVVTRRIIQSIAKDMPQYGESVAVLENSGKIRVIYPGKWTPVVDSQINEVKCHIIMEEFKNEEGTEVVRVDYHYKGYYDRKLYMKNESNGKLGKLISQSLHVKTGQEDFAVYVFTHGNTDEYGLFGYDDYTEIIPFLEALAVTSTIECYAADKYLLPSLQGPGTSLNDGNKANRATFNLKAYHQTLPSHKIEPIDINFDIEKILKHKESLRNNIAMISGMKGTINDNKQNGYAESGTARRMRYADDISASNEIKVEIEPILKVLLSNKSKVTGYDFPVSAIDIVWSASIPLDISEKAEIAGKLNGNKQVQSMRRINEDVMGLTTEAANEDFEDMVEESKLIDMKNDITNNSNINSNTKKLK